MTYKAQKKVSNQIVIDRGFKKMSTEDKIGGFRKRKAAL